MRMKWSEIWAWILPVVCPIRAAIFTREEVQVSRTMMAESWGSAGFNRSANPDSEDFTRWIAAQGLRFHSAKIMIEPADDGFQSYFLDVAVVDEKSPWLDRHPHSRQWKRRNGRNGRTIGIANNGHQETSADGATSKWKDLDRQTNIGPAFLSRRVRCVHQRYSIARIHIARPRRLNE